MHNQLFPLLNAYLDGELRGPRLRDMERHLADCATCQRELDDLRRVSDLLRAAPSPAFTPADRFASNLTLLLPRRPQGSHPSKVPPAAWWLVPAGLLGLWVFIQTVSALTNFVYAAEASGMLAQIAPGLSVGQTQTAWFAAASNLLDVQLNASQQSTLSMLNQVNLFGVNFLQSIFWQAGLLALCVIWFLAWKIWGEPSPVNNL
ncbi:MAG: zf-HC2 domain-containing protein [Chloroflexi bacterium]|nr:zf-HC2 domain-containing protein [Chloroflexota bacterium]